MDNFIERLKYQALIRGVSTIDGLGERNELDIAVELNNRLPSGVRSTDNINAFLSNVLLVAEQHERRLTDSGNEFGSY